MTELATGSLVGLCLFCGVIGIALGRSGSFMKKMGKLHASAHGGSASSRAAAQGGHADQRVQTVVVVGADGQTDRGGEPIAVDRVLLDRAVRAASQGQTHVVELVEANEPVPPAYGDGWPDGLNSDEWAAEAAYARADRDLR